MIIQSSSKFWRYWQHSSCLWRCANCQILAPRSCLKHTNNHLCLMMPDNDTLGMSLFYIDQYIKCGYTRSQSIWLNQLFKKTLCWKEITLFQSWFILSLYALFFFFDMFFRQYRAIFIVLRYVILWAPTYLFIVSHDICYIYTILLCCNVTCCLEMIINSNHTSSCLKNDEICSLGKVNEGSFPFAFPGINWDAEKEIHIVIVACVWSYPWLNISFERWSLAFSYTVTLNWLLYRRHRNY